VWHTSEFVKITVSNTDDNRTQEYESNKRAKEKFAIYVYSEDRSATQLPTGFKFKHRTHIQHVVVFNVILLLDSQAQE
jgi:hypothetical protein